jgi:hypothetical protein
MEKGVATDRIEASPPACPGKKPSCVGIQPEYNHTWNGPRGSVALSSRCRPKALDPIDMLGPDWSKRGIYDEAT